VIQEQRADTLRERAEEKLIGAEKKLAVVEEEKKTQRLLFKRLNRHYPSVKTPPP
jgi:hypothetical protein